MPPDKDLPEANQTASKMLRRFSSLTSDGNHQVLADGSVIEHGQFVVTYTDGTTGRGADVAFEYRDDVHRQDHTVDASGGALL